MQLKTEEQTLSFWMDATEGEDAAWTAACRRLLDAVALEQRATVQRLLAGRNSGGTGLRDWVSAIAFRQAEVPARIPHAVINAYIYDPEAVPLHDCEHCGLAVPVRPNRLHGMESEPEQEYFPTCPVCDGRTGPYYFWSKSAARKPKPR